MNTNCLFNCFDFFNIYYNHQQKYIKLEIKKTDSYLENFPQELLKEIFLKLSVADLIRLQPTCRRWHKIIKENCHVHLCSKIYKFVIDQFNNDSKSMSKKYYVNLTEDKAKKLYALALISEKENLKEFPTDFTVEIEKTLKVKHFENYFYLHGFISQLQECSLTKLKLEIHNKSMDPIIKKIFEYTSNVVKKSIEEKKLTKIAPTRRLIWQIWEA